MCSKLKINKHDIVLVFLLLTLTTVAYQYSVSTFNFEQVFVSRVERKFIMF